MSYLLDKKIKKKKFLWTALGVIFLFLLFYFRVSVFNGLSTVTEGIFHPVLVSGNSLGEKFKSIGSYFSFKNSLYQQNKDLQSKLDEAEAKMINYSSVLADDESIKEILNRKDPKTPMTLAAILSKPAESPYGTLIIDIGASDGVKSGDAVFALGNLPIGRVTEVYQSLSKVILFSSPGEKTQIVISNQTDSSSQSGNIFMEVIGRGGGNFEMTLPKDVTLQKGDPVVLPGINPYVLAVTQSIISDPRDPFTKALLTSPVNIQELKFVQVVKN